MSVYCQNNPKKGNSSTDHLSPSDDNLIYEVIYRKHEDRSRGIKCMNNIDGQIKEALCKNEAVKNEQNMSNCHIFDRLSLEPSFVLKHDRQVEEKKHHPSR